MEKAFDYLYKPIEDWINALKDEIEHGPEGNSRECETGDPFVTIAWSLALTTGGVPLTPGQAEDPSSNQGLHLKPGGVALVNFETKELAWELWLCAFEKYRKGRDGKIYWRKKPEMYEQIYFANYTRYAVKARCFIAKN